MSYDTRPLSHRSGGYCYFSKFTQGTKPSNSVSESENLDSTVAFVLSLIPDTVPARVLHLGACSSFCLHYINRRASTRSVKRVGGIGINRYITPNCL